MSDKFLAPDDVESAFPTVDLTLNKPLWIVGVNFFPKKLVVLAEWSSPEMTGAFGQWVRLYASVAYLAKQGFNFGPKRGYYIAEMASQDLVNQHTQKLHASSVNSDHVMMPSAKSTLMIGVFLGPTGMPFLQTPIHGGRSAKWGGGASASVGLLLQHVDEQLGFENEIVRSLAYEFALYCENDRSPLSNLDASYLVPFVLTEQVTRTDWTDVAVDSGVVPASMFDEPPDSSDPGLPIGTTGGFGDLELSEDVLKIVNDPDYEPPPFGNIDEVEFAQHTDPEPDSEVVANRALEIADSLTDFGKERAAEIHQVSGPDDYTASIYSYSFEIASAYMKRLAYGAPSDDNSAIGEALLPLLLKDEFDYPAWNSAIGTVAARLTVRAIAAFTPVERDYVLSFAPAMALVPGYEESIAAMYAEFTRMYEEEPDGAARQTAASAVQSASDGSVSLYDYMETQKWELIDSAWDDAVEIMIDALDVNDEDGSKIAEMRLTAERWNEGRV